MEIRKIRRERAMARFSDIRDDVRISQRLRETVRSTTGLMPSELEASVRDGVAVLLNGVDKENAYLILYSEPRDNLFIAVVTVNPAAYEDGQPAIVDILSEQEYEALGGILNVQMRRRAVAKVLNQVEQRDWERRHIREDYEPPAPRVGVFYTAADGEVQKRYLKHAPVCRRYIDEHGLENSFGHPGFKPWLATHLGRARIDAGTVVSLEIIDAVRMRLRVNAEEFGCPHCQPAQAVSSPGKAPIGATGWLSRLLKRSAVEA